MKKRWLGGAVIVLGALALAASASAECAWAIWDVHTRTVDGRTVNAVNRYSFHVSRDERWSEILTFATVYQEGSWGDLLDKLRGKGIYGPKAGGSTSWVSRHPNGAVVVFSRSDRYKYRTELLCLPDTVDPREPNWK